MNLMIALTAAQGGAAIANYVGVTGVLKDAGGRARGVAVRDGLTGRAFSVRARGVVNATGCFGDAVRKMDRPDAPPLIQGAAGVHIILPDHFSPASMGLIVPKTRDGRVLFFLPWEGSTICGTTDAPSRRTWRSFWRKPIASCPAPFAARTCARLGAASAR
jgi:glycerol-3-phosphate dehydrogenase